MKRCGGAPIATLLFFLLILGVSCVFPWNNQEKKTPVAPEPVTEYRMVVWERYVELYTSDGPQESWLYDSQGTLQEHSHYRYQEALLVGVDTYSSEAVTNADTQVSRLEYTYDAQRLVTDGSIFHQGPSGLVLSASFAAQYNDVGNYTDYLEKDGEGAVIEHRTCTYDDTGYDYLVETYYSDEGTSNKIEEFRCTYDPVETWKWVGETHYQKITGLDPASVYERTLEHRFSWNGDLMYQQTDFDETGTMTGVILSSFTGAAKRSRSQLNQAGRLIGYRTYQYDDQGVQTEVENFNFAVDPAGVLEQRESVRLWADGQETYYEKAVAVRQEISRSFVSPVQPRDAGARWSPVPASVHHRE